jgi:hypothetical protein
LKGINNCTGVINISRLGVDDPNLKGINNWYGSIKDLPLGVDDPNLKGINNEGSVFIPVTVVLMTLI